jgi:hypothetical protein
LAKSTEVAVKDAAELTQAEAYEALEAKLAAENAAELDEKDLQIPLLKIGQALTTEVTDGDAKAGNFINALTRQDLGREVDFVVASFRKGRFDHGDRKAGKRARKAYGVKNVPWTDDPFYGRPFTEHPDAEETYSARVNNGDLEWGSGPRISTTWDFTGFVIPTDPDETPMPVVLSLMRKNKKAAQKWVTVLSAVLKNRYWDGVFELSTEQQRGGEGTYYTVTVKGPPATRKTTTAERMEAMDLAQRVRALNVEIVGDDDDTAPKKEPVVEGGLEV